MSCFYIVVNGLLGIVIDGVNCGLDWLINVLGDFNEFGSLLLSTTESTSSLWKDSDVLVLLPLFLVLGTSLGDSLGEFELRRGEFTEFVNELEFLLALSCGSLVFLLEVGAHLGGIVAEIGVSFLLGGGLDDDVVGLDDAVLVGEDLVTENLLGFLELLEVSGQTSLVNFVRRDGLGFRVFLSLHFVDEFLTEEFEEIFNTGEDVVVDEEVSVHGDLSQSTNKGDVVLSIAVHDTVVEHFGGDSGQVNKGSSTGVESLEDLVTTVDSVDGSLEASVALIEMLFLGFAGLSLDVEVLLDIGLGLKVGLKLLGS